MFAFIGGIFSFLFCFLFFSGGGVDISFLICFTFVFSLSYYFIFVLIYFLSFLVSLLCRLFAFAFYPLFFCLSSTLISFLLRQLISLFFLPSFSYRFFSYPFSLSTSLYSPFLRESLLGRKQSRTEETSCKIFQNAKRIPSPLLHITFASFRCSVTKVAKSHEKKALRRNLPAYSFFTLIFACLLLEIPPFVTDFQLSKTSWIRFTLPIKTATFTRGPKPPT